jgi:GNAT superfamily N-acetyltransferase
VSWSLTGDVDEFAAAAGAFLRSRPAEHTVLLSIVETLRRRGPRAYGDADPVFGWWTAGGGVEGAFLRTPPRPPLLAQTPPAAAAALAGTLAGHALPGINAGAEAADAFAEEWCRRTGATAEVGRRTRLYRLGDLLEPRVPGAARAAGPGDRDLLIDWYEAFERYIGEDRGNVGDVVDDVLGHGGMVLWEVDGTPVSMAGRTRPSSGVVRVAPVYTPEELRGRGYGGAATAATTRAALDAGAAEVVLFTDLANPASNAVYQRLGYRPVEDRVVLSFG